MTGRPGTNKGRPISRARCSVIWTRFTSADRLWAARRDLAQHWAGITAPDAPSLGSIAGEIYHQVARRLKGGAARWSPAGIDHLVRRLATATNGELAQALAIGCPQPAGTMSQPVLPCLRRQAGTPSPLGSKRTCRPWMAPMPVDRGFGFGGCCAS